MTFDPEILQALGGGIYAVVIAALAWAYTRERNRTDALTDRLMDVHRSTINTLNDLTRAIERGGR